MKDDYLIDFPLRHICISLSEIGRMYFLSRRVKAEVPVVRPSTPVSRRRARNAAFQSTITHFFMLKKKTLFETSEIRFGFAVRSPRFWISGYCTKWRNSRVLFIARIRVPWTPRRSQETHYLSLILPDTFVKCICRNISCAQGKWSLHSRRNVVSTFTESHGHSDERWPMKLTSNSDSAMSLCSP